MSEPIWVLDSIVEAVHSILLSEHGGGSGLRDKSLLQSALARPQQKWHYNADATLFELAAAYSFGIAKNHPFVDGNKRTALTIGALFLNINGYILQASEVDATLTFQQLASGSFSEDELVIWFEKHSSKT